MGLQSINQTGFHLINNLLCFILISIVKAIINCLIHFIIGILVNFVTKYSLCLTNDNFIRNINVSLIVSGHIIYVINRIVLFFVLLFLCLKTNGGLAYPGARPPCLSEGFPQSVCVSPAPA